MLFALDIDKTLGIDTIGYARYINSVLALGIDKAIIDGLKTYQQFKELAQVQEFRARHEQRYQEALEAADHDLEVIAAMVPLSGAVEAVNMLAQEGKIIYATCRWPEEETATHDWLKRYGFPSAEEVYCCPHYHWKYLATYEASERKELVVLIDDMMPRLVKSFGKVVREQPKIASSLLKRLEVVGIGYEESPELPRHMPFAYSILPSWEKEHLEAWRARKVAA